MGKKAVVFGSVFHYVAHISRQCVMESAYGKVSKEYVGQNNTQDFDDRIFE